MDDGVRPSQLKFNQVLHESSKHWFTHRKAADASSLLPYHCIDLTSLLGRIPAFLACGQISDHELFSFTCQEREAGRGRYGLLTSGHSVWRTSDGHCDTEPKIIPLQLLLAVPEPLKIRFSDNAPLANWPGVQGISGNGGDNYITPLFLAWAYILSAKWFELLGRSPRHACKQKYIEGTPTQDLFRFDVGYVTDEDEDRWWKAILSFGWEMTTDYEGRTYLSPWSVTTSDTTFSGEKSHLVDSDPPSCHTALGYVTRFYRHYGIYDQFSAALAAALYIPLSGGRTIQLPMPKNPTKEQRLAPAVSADSCSNSFYEHSALIPYYMTLSCNTLGMRSLLCSTFFNADIECNMVSAWLKPCLAIIDPLIKCEEFTKLATLLGNRQPNVAALWLGAIIVGIAKSVIQDIRIGLVALDLHAAAWTSTIESFITTRPGKPNEAFISREDECRLLFILGSEGHTRPPRSPWKPFGRTPLTETELEIQYHANCNCHCLEYLSWHWKSSDGKTLEDTGLDQSPKEKCGTEIEPPNNSPEEAYLFDQSELLSEIATRGIFEWLRSNGYPASENFIHRHPWFDIESSEGEEIDGVSDDEVDQQSRKASTEKWIMGTDILLTEK